MSRTRKDRPLWVRTNDPNEIREEFHRHHSLYNREEFSICEIDMNAMPDHQRKEQGFSPRCGYELGYHNNHFYYLALLGEKHRKRNRRLVYNKSERRRKRDELNEAKKIYTAQPDIDDLDYINYPARHSMRYYRW